jgi:hypothetical protein
LQQIKQHAFEIIFTGSVFILIVCRAIFMVADTDLWGHIRFGQDMLRLGAVPLQDPYSYLTENSKWINHEWLSEVIFALFYNAGGTLGLVALKSFFVITISLLLWRSLLKSGFSSMASAALMIFVQLLLAITFPPLRPNLFTCLFFTLELIILTIYSKKITTKQPFIILLLPLLFLAWANVHGAFIMGLIILLVYWLSSTAQTIWSRDWQKLKQQNLIFFLIILLTVAVTLINPYGYELLNYLMKTNGMTRTLFMKGPLVSEWLPVFKVSPLYTVFYTFTAGFSIASIIFSRKPKYLGLIMTWFLLAGTTFLVYRILPLFCIATVILIGPYLADCWNRLWSPFVHKPHVYWIFLSAMTIILFLFTAGLLTQLSGTPGQLQSVVPMPARVVCLLKQTKSKANVLVEFNWAEYFIWHLGPTMKVAIDPRCETVYSDYCLYHLYSHFSKADTHWDDIVDQVPTELVLIGSNSKVAELMALKPAWIKVYADPISCIFAKKDSPIQKSIMEINQTNIPASIDANAFP